MSKTQSVADYQGDGVTTSFTLPSGSFTNFKHLLVYVDGLYVKQVGNLATTISISPAPVVNADIKVLGAVDYNEGANLVTDATGTVTGIYSTKDGTTISLGGGSSTGITSITNADAYAAQFVGKYVKSKQYRNFPAVAAQRRLALYQKSRVLAIVRNLSATETIRIATTAANNGNRNAPAYADGVYGTDSPKSKYMLIPPLQAYITTYDPSQIWSKSTANVNNICIELWSLP